MSISLDTTNPRETKIINTDYPGETAIIRICTPCPSDTKPVVHTGSKLNKPPTHAISIQSVNTDGQSKFCYSHNEALEFYYDFHKIERKP